LLIDSLLTPIVESTYFCKEVPQHIAWYFNRLTKSTVTGENRQRKTDVAAGPGQEKC